MYPAAQMSTTSRMACHASVSVPLGTSSVPPCARKQKAGRATTHIKDGQQQRSYGCLSRTHSVEFFGAGPRLGRIACRGLVRDWHRRLQTKNKRDMRDELRPRLIVAVTQCVMR